MKQNRIFSLLLLGLLWLSSSTIWALESKDGIYQIGTAEDLAEFAELVNGGESTANAVLTADIDFSAYQVMIGNTTTYYAGTFDGAYHTVTVGYTDPTENYTALIQAASGTVKNLCVTGTITTGKKYAAGIVGLVSGATIDGCISTITVNSSVDGDATHGGIVGTATNEGTIQNCISAFTLRGENTTNCGGIVGWLSGTTYLYNNLQIADIQIKQESGSATFCRNNGNQKGSNNYFMTNYGTKDNSAKQITADQLTSGEVCYLLNGNNDKIRFYQTLGVDATPVLDPTHAQVYAQGDVRCDGKAVSGTLTYTNTVQQKPSHQYVDGFCSVCGNIQEDFVTLSADGYYEIGTIAQMEWFASLVNNGNTKSNGRLTASLNYDGYNHTTIGTTGNQFRGMFDGGHFPILNLETMLFGTANGATIENVDVRGGSITQNTNYAAHTGSIVGNAGATSNKTYIRNCSSTAEMTNVSTDCGGIVGKIVGVVENCYFGGNLVNCTSTSGGIAGSSNSADCSIRNCYVTSETLTGNASYLGNFVGYFHSGAYMTNCYRLENDNALSNAGNNGGTTENCELVSADRFASGEIAYLLNEKNSDNPAFYQTIGQDAYPVLDPSHGIVYANGQVSCDGTPVGDELTYSNSQTSTRPDHQYVNGVCEVCGTVNTDYATTDENGYYLIDSASKLEWFAAMVNKAGKTESKALQTADIDLAGIEHTPIGNKGQQFRGTYNGQDYAINNLSAMLFGTLGGATLTHINIASGDIVANSDIADHVGTIAGACTTNAANTISYCGSKANISGASCDAGGLVGKMYGTISYSYFAGQLDCASTCGGIVGSSYDADNVATINNCYVFSTLMNGNTSYLGTFLGYYHGSCTISNCYGYSPCERQFGYNGGTASNVTDLTEEQFNNGEAAWLMNSKSFTNAIWYQTLGEDASPVLNSTHGLVYKISDEEYASQQDEETLKTMTTFLASDAQEYASTVIAQKSLKDEYTAALSALTTSISTREELIAAYQSIEAQLKALQTSEAAYKTYSDKVDEIIAYLEENDDLNGPDKDLLVDYLESDIAPNDELPNGSYVYIMENLLLDNEQIVAEADFAQKLLETAIANDIKVGSEITNLLTNANLADGYTGWQGKTGTGTGGVKEVMPVGECWSNTMDMYQTLTDMPNGVYELQVNAAFRPYASVSSTQQASMIYANTNNVYVSNVIEDMVKTEDAVDQVNCYITEGGSNPDYEITDEEGNIIGYVMHGYNSASYGFAAGRHLNHILAYVNDGVVTVGLKTMGSGQSADWTGFGNFRLFYRGSLDEAGEALDNTLADQLARANTLLNNYEPVSDENYPYYPNYSQALKDEVAATMAAVPNATTGEEKYALIQKFSQLFQDVYDCKMAYIDMLKTMEKVDASLWELVDRGTASQEAIDEEKKVADAVWSGYTDGSYSLEEAQAQNDIRSLIIYQYVFGVEPEQIDGVYQIANGNNLRWFQLAVNNGTTNLKAVQTAPIDMSTIAIDPIGNTTNMFNGSYDGQFFPLTNVNCMLFGTVNGATITRVAIESGTITMNTDYAAHTGSIVGAVGTDEENSITQCYSKADLVDCSNDAGGIAGKFWGTIQDCYYTGNMTCTSTTGGIVGSSYDSSHAPVIKNCHVYSQTLQGNATYLGVFIGYYHGNATIDDCYGLSGVTGKLEGYMGGTQNNVAVYSADEFASGSIAYQLSQNTTDGVWFQTLGEDAYPVLDSTHKMIVKNEDGTFGNTDAIATIQAGNSERVNVYDMQGRLIRTNVTPANSLINLPKGIYVVGDRKVAK